MLTTMQTNFKCTKKATDHGRYEPNRYGDGNSTNVSRIYWLSMPIQRPCFKYLLHSTANNSIQTQSVETRFGFHSLSTMKILNNLTATRLAYSKLLELEIERIIFMNLFVEIQMSIS